MAKKDTVEEDFDVFDTKTCYGFAGSFGLTKAQLEFCNRSKRQADGYHRWAKRVPELLWACGMRVARCAGLDFQGNSAGKLLK